MTPASQADTIAFLSRGAAYGEPNAEVERIETHISVIFLVGSRVFKLKRAVAFSYLDFSSVASRRRACEAEFALGRRMSTTLYHAVRRVTRGLDGGFALDGEGAPVDFLVEMRRFGQDALFDHMAEHGRLDPAMMRDLADAIAAFHAAAEPAPDGCTPDAISALIGDVAANLAAARIFTSAEIEVLRSRLDAELKANRVTIERRRAEGRVRRCHGDLHLRNICFVDGKPMLFDPIEFSAARRNRHALRSCFPAHGPHPSRPCRFRQFSLQPLSRPDRRCGWAGLATALSGVARRDSCACLSGGGARRCGAQLFAAGVGASWACTAGAYRHRRTQWHRQNDTGTAPGARNRPRARRAIGAQRRHP